MNTYRNTHTLTFTEEFSVTIISGLCLNVVKFTYWIEVIFYVLYAMMIMYDPVQMWIWLPAVFSAGYL